MCRILGGGGLFRSGLKKKPCVLAKICLLTAFLHDYWSFFSATFPANCAISQPLPRLQEDKTSAYDSLFEYLYVRKYVFENDFRQPSGRARAHHETDA